ncbi:hypothetical protein KUV57_13715 [Epibacterium sp. DP7N7-1]|nr:hypothetical protein [Epibacterium sp. DP7N7-1]
MERTEPIMADMQETISGFRSRSIAHNLARIGIGVAIGGTLFTGAAIINYSGPQILDAALEAATPGSQGISPEVVGAILLHSLDGLSNDVTEMLQATKDIFTVQTEHFRNGTLIEAHKDYIKGLPGGEQAYAAFENALSAPMAEGGATLAEKFGPDAVGLASICVIAGSVLYSGAKAIRKAMNLAASGFKQAREAVGRLIDRVRGFEPPSEPRVFDPFEDETPAALTGDPDKEREVHAQFAELMEEAGLQQHQALGVADFVVKTFIAGAESQRRQSEQMDELQSEISRSLASVKLKIRNLQEQVNALSDPEKQRQKMKEILEELSVEQLGAQHIEPQPDMAPEL